MLYNKEFEILFIKCDSALVFKPNSREVHLGEVLMQQLQVEVQKWAEVDLHPPAVVHQVLAEVGMRLVFDRNQDIDAAAEVLRDGVEVHLNEGEVRQDEVDLVGEVGMIRNLADPFEGVEVHIVHVADILDNAAGVGDSFHWVDNFDYNHLEADILEEAAVLGHWVDQAVLNIPEDTGCNLDKDKVD